MIPISNSNTPSLDTHDDFRVAFASENTILT